jgi:hypothetical protein
MEIKDIADNLGKIIIEAPKSWGVFLFGGIFVIYSIAHGRYFIESFSTFVYGIVASYLWILGKGEKPRIGKKLYFILHLFLVLFWMGVILVGHIDYFERISKLI